MFYQVELIICMPDHTWFETAIRIEPEEIPYESTGSDWEDTEILETQQLIDLASEKWTALNPKLEVVAIALYSWSKIEEEE